MRTMRALVAIAQMAASDLAEKGFRSEDRNSEA